MPKRCGHIAEYLAEKERVRRENEEECDRLLQLDRLLAVYRYRRPSLLERIRRVLWV